MRLVVLAVVSLVVAACSITTHSTKVPPPSAAPSDAQQIIVERIVDGDTIIARAARPGPTLANTRRIRVRLLEIDAPETAKEGRRGECYADRATAHLRELLNPGATAFVTADKERRDHYDRYLLYVWNMAGEFVNRRMISDGAAKTMLVKPNDRYIEAMRDAEREARRAHRGMWGSC